MKHRGFLHLVVILTSLASAARSESWFLRRGVSNFGIGSGTPGAGAGKYDPTPCEQVTDGDNCPAPSQRTGSAMAFDMRNRQVVLFGGRGTTVLGFSWDKVHPLGDTWVWDGEKWTTAGGPAKPSPRYGHAMAYDAWRRQVILFGGGGGDAGILNDTWVWDGKTWTQKSPQTIPQVGSPMLAYDVVRRQTVLFGSGSQGSETWVWDGSDWHRQSPLVSPLARTNSAMAYDAIRGEIVLFGGTTAAGNVGDTWTWNGSSWQQRTPAASPEARYGHAMAFDAAHGVVLLVGGASVPLNDGTTWAWDGATWTRRSANNPPQQVLWPAVAYDAARHELVMVGSDKPDYFAARETYFLRANLMSSNGTPQSAPTGKAFKFPLEVAVVDSLGNPVNAAAVSFTAPASMLTLSPSRVTTDVNGRARVNAVAGLVAGAYTVKASLDSGESVSFLLSNLNTAPANSKCPVTTAVDDDSPGSLRSRIATCGLGANIGIGSGTYIALRQQEIAIEQDVTIDGGYGATIDGLGLSRIFTIGPSMVYPNASVVLRNLTLQNGAARGGDGQPAFYPGGGAAGMGGAIFQNLGTLTVSNVSFVDNQAQGGNTGLRSVPVDSIGAGGGLGGSASGYAPVGNTASPGGGGSLGPSSAGGDPTATNHDGGFGAGGDRRGIAGFGGGAGAGSVGGVFANGPDYHGDRGGSGAGLGGAIFVRRGALILQGATFTGNRAFGGDGRPGTSFSSVPAEGKGGALFIATPLPGVLPGLKLPGAKATYVGVAPNFQGNTAGNAGTGTRCDSVNGAGSLDTPDVCGILSAGQ